jgi:hypothetical protein
MARGAMARGAMTRGDLGVDFIFVYDRDRVNSQIGLPYVSDHRLARLPDAVMSHVVPGLSLRESCPSPKPHPDAK